MWDEIINSPNPMIADGPILPVMFSNPAVANAVYFIFELCPTFPDKQKLVLLQRLLLWQEDSNRIMGEAAEKAKKSEIV